MAKSFIDELVDWKAFEQFVHDMYAQDERLVVEHDVTETGRSGARRQTDVKLTHRIGSLVYVTLIECKRWKEKVSRDRIDVLAASVDDLNAAKGVMFTTTGFEEGAELYAKSKGIELFLVRDLTDEEWGLPGREVSFWWHTYSGQLDHFDIGQAQLASVVEKPPANVGLQITIGPHEVLDPAMTLHSVVDGIPGPNLVQLLLEARRRALELLAQGVELFDDQAEDAHRAFLVPLELDLRAFETRQLLRNYGALRFDSIRCVLLADVYQYRFRYDRGETFDIALAVENYVTHQREVVSRSSREDAVGVAELAPTGVDSGPQDAVSENTLLQIFTEPWVALPPDIQRVFPCRAVTFTLPGWRVTVSETTPGDSFGPSPRDA